MTSLSCTVDGCTSPVKRQALCYAHYMKNWRYGTPTPQHEPKWVDLTGQRFGLLTVQERNGDKWACICDCGGSRNIPAGDLNRPGRKSCGDRSKHPTRQRSKVMTYRQAHNYMRHLRGSARRHACVDCGAPAKQWSYTHQDPQQLWDYEISVGPVPYSQDPSYYDPRCIPCHKHFDLSRLR